MLYSTRLSFRIEGDINNFSVIDIAKNIAGFYSNKDAKVLNKILAKNPTIYKNDHIP